MGCNCGKTKQLAKEKQKLKEQLLPSQELHYNRETQHWEIIEKRAK